MEVPSQQAAATPEPSALLRLPAELRNTIYELVAESGDDIIFEYDTAVNLHTSLAAANHQFMDEYLPIFYDRLGRMERIQATVENFELCELGEFLHHLPAPHHGGMRKLEVTFAIDGDEDGFAADEELFVPWAMAITPYRKALAQVKYKFEMDWTHAIDDWVEETKLNLVMLQYEVVDWRVEFEVESINEAFIEALCLREDELELELEDDGELEENEE